jgi:hypothetical protein
MSDKLQFVISLWHRLQEALNKLEGIVTQMLV